MAFPAFRLTCVSPRQAATRGPARRPPSSECFSVSRQTLSDHIEPARPRVVLAGEDFRVLSGSWRANAQAVASAFMQSPLLVVQSPTSCGPEQCSYPPVGRGPDCVGSGPLSPPPSQTAQAQGGQRQPTAERPCPDAVRIRGRRYCGGPFFPAPLHAYCIRNTSQLVSASDRADPDAGSLVPLSGP